MNICQKCQKIFSDRVSVDGKIRTVHKRKFCIECSPIGSYLSEKRKEIECRKNNKQCKQCKEEKTTNNFHKDSSSPDGFHKACKLCRLISRKIFYAKNKDRLKEWLYSYRKNNPEKIKATQRKRLPKIRKRMKERYENDICFKLKVILRTRLRSSIQEMWKTGSSVADIGCSMDELKIYIEKKFYPNPRTGEPMTWENWKKFGWHIDHVIPLSSFNLANKEELLKAVHYTNLQPMWWFENLSKGSSV